MATIAASFGLFLLTNAIWAQTVAIVCNEPNCGNYDSLAANLFIECTEQDCQLECNATQACDGILYSCNNGNDMDTDTTSTTTCTVLCSTTLSCTNLTVTSNSHQTHIDCNAASSCVESSFLCSGAECNLECGSDSCVDVNYICTGEDAQCSTQCEGNACNDKFDMICDAFVSGAGADDGPASCDLSCNGVDTCADNSSFLCSDDSNTHCTCGGYCSDLLTAGNIHAHTSPPLSHTFDVVDVEVYATFTILWLALLLFSAFICWRLHVTLHFFRNIRTVVMLVSVCGFEIFFYFLLCFILWANAVAYSVESSVHFYLWTSFLPTMLHLSLFFSLCAYYNKHFRRRAFMALFCCYGAKKRKIPRIIKQFNLFLFVMFMLPMIGTIAAHTEQSIVAVAAFIGLFGLLGILMSTLQILAGVVDICNYTFYEQQEERVLVVFVFCCSVLFLIIFGVNIAVAFSWRAANTRNNVENIRVTQLVMEWLVLLLVSALVFYIYYDFITGRMAEDDGDDGDNEGNEHEHDTQDADDDTSIKDTALTVQHKGTVTISTQSAVAGVNRRDTSEATWMGSESNGGDPHVVRQPTESRKRGPSSPRRKASSARKASVFNDPSDDDDDDDEDDAQEAKVADAPKRKVPTMNTVDVVQSETKNDDHEIPDITKRKSAPPSIETKLLQETQSKKARQRQLPDLPTFGAPLSKQKTVTVDDNKDVSVPQTLMLLKQYLFDKNGDSFVGIFANGNVDNIQHSPEFVDGIVSKVDCYGMKRLIENGQLSSYAFAQNDDRHYAMVFAELIKMWLFMLPSPLLQEMPSTYFANIRSTQDFDSASDKLPPLTHQTLVVLLDIANSVAEKASVNQMTSSRLAEVFAPYLCRDANAETKATLVRFFELAMTWRQEQLGLMRSQSIPL